MLFLLFFVAKKKKKINFKNTLHIYRYVVSIKAAHCAACDCDELVSYNELDKDHHQHKGVYIIICLCPPMELVVCIFKLFMSVVKGTNEPKGTTLHKVIAILNRGVSY